jgi:hypothetical protein
MQGGGPKREFACTIALMMMGLGCETHDIGKPCYNMISLDPPKAGGTRLETQEVVEQNVEFPCNDMICVSTDGRAGYCSRKCREDAGCPAGFECRQVQQIGEFAGDKLCVWKRCERPKDCGSRDEFKCCRPDDVNRCGAKIEGLRAEAGEELKLCTFRD